MRKASLFICLFGAVCLLADVVIERTEKAPVLDGVLSPGEWKAVEAQFHPVPCKEDEKSEVQTDLYMQYDDDYLYVALTYDQAESVTQVGEIFRVPRFELRFGDEEKVDYFVAAFNGTQYPADGWELACRNGVMEIRLPLERIRGFRKYIGNIVREDAPNVLGGASSLFPIRVRSFVDPSYHRQFLLGSAKEIEAAQKKLEDDRKAGFAEAERLAEQMRSLAKANILGKKALAFQLPEAWRPFRFKTGKDFHFMFRPRGWNENAFSVPGRENTLPLFQDAVYQVHTWELNRGFRDKKEPIRKLLDSPETTAAGYILRKTDNLIMFTGEGGYSTYEHEVQEIKETREEFVRDFGHRLLCVDVNESVGPGGGFPTIMRLAGLQPKSKKESYEALKKVAFDPGRTYIRDWAVFYPELLPFRGPVSATFTEHIYLSFGFCMTGNECGPKTLNMPFSYAVSRGAARQYGKPFRIFQTNHDDLIVFPGWEGAFRHYTQSDHRFVLRPQTRVLRSSEKDGRVYYGCNAPMYGIPYIDWRRSFIYSYMNGTNIYFDESGHYLLYANYDYKTIDNEDPLVVNLRQGKTYLSKLGEMMTDFYDNIVCKEDRGSVYTPVAFVWNLYHGHFPNYNQTPWGLFPCTEADLMMHAIENTLFPRDRKRVYYNRGFRTSPCGDIFDVITNDAGVETLDSYPVLFFSGEVPVDQAFADKLVAYVSKGGTLVVNWKQVEDFVEKFPAGFFGAKVSSERRGGRSSYSRLSGKVLHENKDFKYHVAELLAGAQSVVLTCDSRRDPLVISNSFGEGKVVLTMPDFLKERYSNSAMLNIFTDLLLGLSRDALPVNVDGDIQYQVCRNQKGWLVALYNNYGGTDRNWQQPQKEPGPESAVTVTIRPKMKYSSVREWFTGDKSLTLSVPGGEVRIVEIAE